MANVLHIALRDELWAQVTAAAKRENMTIDEFVASILEQGVAAPQPPQRGSTLSAMLDIIDADTSVEWRVPGDASAHVKEIMETEYVDEYYARLKEATTPTVPSIDDESSTDR